MKTGGARGKYIRPIVIALERAGFDLVSRSTSHFHYGRPGRPKVTVPSKLDDIKIAKRIAKIAGVTLIL